MSGTFLAGKPDSVQDGSSGTDSDEVLSKVRFYFMTGRPGHPDSTSKAIHPSFMHQVYDDEAKLALLGRISHIDITIDCISWMSYITARSIEGTPLSGLEESTAAIRPILDKLFAGSFYLDRGKFDDARGVEDELIEASYRSLAPIDLGEGKFRLLHATLETNALTTRLTARLQPFLLFFIDGASIIDLADRKWQVSLLLEGNSNAIVGFCSAYPFLLFPEGVRLRISQFFILPPRQRHGLGRILYEAILKRASQDESIHEITVEDPNDAFAALRLTCDRDFLASVRHADLVRRLTPLARAEAELLQQYEQQADATDAEFRKAVKKFLLRRHPQCIPLEREAKFRVLDTLFTDQLGKFKRVKR